MMDVLCGTSSLWLYPVPALEPYYNRNGKRAPHTSVQDSLTRFCTLVIAAATYGEETFVPGTRWDVGTCTDGVGVSKEEATSKTSP